MVFKRVKNTIRVPPSGATLVSSSHDFIPKHDKKQNYQENLIGPRKHI